MPRTAGVAGTSGDTRFAGPKSAVWYHIAPQGEYVFRPLQSRRRLSIIGSVGPSRGEQESPQFWETLYRQAARCFATFPPEMLEPRPELQTMLDR